MKIWVWILALFALGHGAVAKPEMEPVIHAVVPKPARAGTYTVGEWTYQLVIAIPGSRSERRFGKLFHQAQEQLGKPGDSLATPLGRFWYVDELYSRGWLTELTYGRAISGVCKPKAKVR